MKKFLFATSALVMTAGYAAADVTIDGYGRFGLSYYQKGHGAYTSGDMTESDNAADNSKTWMEQRLRFNIKASTETDNGVEFGAKLRMQFDDGDTGSDLNAAQFYVSYEGALIQVGNVDTALDVDSSGLFFASEIGVTDTSFGDSRSSYFGYDSKAYGDGGRTGIYGSYSIAGVTIDASYIDPNQYGANGYFVEEGTGAVLAKVKSEKSLVISYANDDLTLAAGGTKDGSGIAKNDIWYLGAAYNFTPEFRAGLNYIHEGKDVYGYKLGKTVTVYGSYTTGPLQVIGYVANYNGYDDEITYDGMGYKKDTVFGLGANYDLGGGTSLRAAIHRDGYSETYGELGVKFNF